MEKELMGKAVTYKHHQGKMLHYIDAHYIDSRNYVFMAGFETIEGRHEAFYECHFRAGSHGEYKCSMKDGKFDIVNHNYI